VPRRSRCIRPVPSSTRACGAVWHHRSPSVSLRGAGVRATVFRTETPGFFALAARTPSLRVARRGASAAAGGHELPAPIGWGSGRRARGPGACCRLAGRPDSLLDCRAGFARPETPYLRTGLAPANVSLHAPSTGSTWARQWAKQILPDTTIEGRSPVFRPSLALSTLATRRKTCDPVRVFDLLRRSTPSSRAASRPCSSPSPGCLELRFYNRRCASRAPAETSPLETVSRPSVGNPPNLDLSDHHRSHGVSAEPGATLDRLSVIQPPAAARLTACCRLRVDRLSPSCPEAWG
jgi:hypothetical protein